MQDFEGRCEAAAVLCFDVGDSTSLVDPQTSDHTSCHCLLAQPTAMGQQPGLQLLPLPLGPPAASLTPRPGMCLLHDKGY